MHAWLSLIAGIVAAGGVQALDFARPFGDFMVLPHGVPCPVWGTGQPDAAVEVSFGAHRLEARCDAGGAWRVVLPPLEATATGATLTVRSGAVTRQLKDVLAGEVWLCSGQSNMDFPLGRAIGGREEAAMADDFPAIRLRNLTGAPTDDRTYGPETLARLTPQKHFHGSWTLATESSANSISAIAWWTAKAIHQARHMPVGIVENAVGGSGAEAWTPRESLAAEVGADGLLDHRWLDSPRIGAWARARAKRNLGDHLDAPHPYQPGFLFESGVRWWRGFPFTGVMWYQGESNAEVRDDRWNEALIVALVNGWRTALDQPRLPFFMVQLPRIGGNDPLRAHWPEFRNVQARAVNRLAHAHLITTQDLGWDSPDVHPPDKRPVAERLAAAILAKP